MNAKQKIAALEKRLAEVDAQANAPLPCPPDAIAQVAMCEKAPSRPSKAERRAKLIAAHLALSEVRHELNDWTHNEATRTQILAAIGRLEIE